MAKAYLIGGSPRCGKTSIALSLIGQQPMFATSTDAVRLLLRDRYQDDRKTALFATLDLFSEDICKDLCAQGRVDEIVMAQNAESEIVWRSVRQIIKEYIHADMDVLVEGVSILPHLLADLDCEYQAVFVGKTLEGHGADMLRHARSGGYDWMANFSDEYIEQFEKFTMKYSNFIKQECEKRGMDYFENNGSFDQFVSAVSSKLQS